MINNYMLFKNLPTLDLHGETVASSKVLIDAFLKEHYKNRNQLVKIVHGIGTGVLKKNIPLILKSHPLVLKYQTDFFNSGVLIVEIKERITKC